MDHTRIISVHAREILDSRGNPTVEAEIGLENGISARASVPSGASTGKYEAYEMRDEGATRYYGRGVVNAVEHVKGEIAEAICGISALDQKKIDSLMCSIDGTPQKEVLGANAILSVSFAVAKAAAASQKKPLWQYLGGGEQKRMPAPMMNIINGGAHAKNGLDIQEFMIVPLGAPSFREGLRIGTEIFHTLGKLLHEHGYSVGVGDEGGYAPELDEPEEALKWIVEAVEKAGYSTDTVKVALDVAASEWVKGRAYYMPKSKRHLTREELTEMLAELATHYPVLSIEDPLGEDDIEGFSYITSLLGRDRLIVGDDLFVTNPERLRMGMECGAGNTILIKPNQIGTVSETLGVIELAQKNGYRHILSHRSGETDETFIADLAVATNACLIKTGAPCRGERVAKYNHLLRIAEQIGKDALYGFEGTDMALGVKHGGKSET